MFSQEGVSLKLKLAMSVTMILMAAKDLRGMNYVLTTHSLLNRVRKVDLPASNSGFGTRAS